MEYASAPAPLCPPGFDCAFLNSCPSYFIECPNGYFCDSYKNYTGEGEMDFRYAQYQQRNGWADVTQENKEQFCDKDKAIQVKCLFGFFCSSSSAMKACPEGHWCSESTVVPNKCEALSYCPENSGFQINFMATLIAILMSIAVFAISYRLVSRQRRENNLSRNKDPTNCSYITPNSSSKDLASQHKTSSHSLLVEASFQDLHFQVEGDGSDEDVIKHQFRDILPNISGKIPAGKFSVILGPTACGKSTLLNLIRKGGKGATGGEVTVSLVGSGVVPNSNNSNPTFQSAPVSRANSHHHGTSFDFIPNTPPTKSSNAVDIIEFHRTPSTSSTTQPLTTATGGSSAYTSTSTAKNTPRTLTKSDLPSYIGYVPQEDILDRELTIRELLTFNIKARLPHIQSQDEIDSILNGVLSDLAIQHVADSIIGGGENMSANISGGQLKRVNIAVELVALSSPALLLLDEPTAGLDAAIAYDLIVSLETVMRHKGITILAVLQQPRAEIFEKIDHLFLMDVEGNIVYEGPSSEVVAYLMSIGFVKPGEDTADADFCIDVLNGLADRVDDDTHAQSTATHKQQHHQGNNTNNAIPSKENKHKSSPLHLHQSSGNRSMSASHTRSALLEFSLLDAWQVHCRNAEISRLGLQTDWSQYSSVSIDSSRSSQTKNTLNSSKSTQNTSEKKKNSSFTNSSVASIKTPAFSLDRSVPYSLDTERTVTTTVPSESFDYFAWTLRFLYLCKLNAERLFLVRFRNVSSLLVYFSINLIMACALSSGFSILMTETYLSILAPPTRNNLQGYYPSPLSDYSEDNVNDFSIALLVFFMSSSLGCASCLSSVPVFAGQLPQIKREHSAGLSIFAYAIGRMTADLVFVVFNAMVFTGTWMVFGHVGSYYNWMATIIATAFAASAIGYITAAMSKQNNAAVYSIITILICCVFNGSEPTLTDVSKYTVLSWPWYVSFAMWTSEATYITWSEYLNNNGNVSDPVQEGADHYGYKVSNGLGRPIGALIALGVAMRVIATIILYYKAKAK